MAKAMTDHRRANARLASTQKSFSMPLRRRPCLMALMAAALLAMLAPAGPEAIAALQYTGVNLAGAEFGANVLPGTYNTHYTYPNQSEVDYFRSKGLNTFRLCFRWERLQQATNANFNATEFTRFHTFVATTTGKGMYVIL